MCLQNVNNIVNRIIRKLLNYYILLQQLICFTKKITIMNKLLMTAILLSVSSQVKAVNEGSTTIQIPVATITNGIINVSLHVNGECVDSKKIL